MVDTTHKILSTKPKENEVIIEPGITVTYTWMSKINKDIITQDDIDTVASLKGIASLDLQGAIDNELDMSALSHIKLFSLSHIKTAHIKSPDISPLINLESFCIHNCRSKSIELPSLKHCRKIELVDIGKNRFMSLDFTPFRGSLLKQLRIWKVKNIVLTKLPSIKELTISDTKIKEIDLSLLETPRWLESLTVRFNKKLELLDISPLENCKNLRMINIHSNPLREIKIGKLNEKFTMTPELRIRHGN